ncbi:nuclear transport factor 2 family protein [uncultured Maribacter sp.]|uniref:nuclear transport factor 2 family protein n=1 Tax=uncultured Maribacter sp. TaxID=431308 RepID=UPI002628BA67|nr:nuclear transport factor 2 family protein [uncultured Maribacter sp.]
MEQNKIMTVVKSYPEAFKLMDTSLIDKNFTKNASKTGVLYDYETKKWGELTNANIEEIKKWVTVHNKENSMPDIHIKSQIIDIQDKIALVKIELEWIKNIKGSDYILLVKKGNEWLIDKIYYQSII